MMSALHYECSLLPDAAFSRRALQGGTHHHYSGGVSFNLIRTRREKFAIERLLAMAGRTWRASIEQGWALAKHYPPGRGRGGVRKVHELHH
ncbi:hypothetical protein [Paraburkholderia humisilvae]|uniref:Uncharacterized protein n=1 Tax=Paraburkholderia humisilvae TaxID=627669 RepID=A0A6J5F5V4_9BURK|nr:hypothetical protein [Paraburkholderia humisilvae]CAB3774240.1 hypothetical protein LMG29542_07661 [Paraburkholderia humisilvae]